MVLALGGADLVLVPQAGTVGEWPDGLFEAEMRVAAFQNGYFVGLCNRVGVDGSLTFAGESFVPARWRGRSWHGRFRVRSTSCWLYPDPSAAERSHARRLFFEHRRPELYASWFGPVHSPTKPGV